MDGQANHVHLLVNYPANRSISTLLNSLKGVSSRMLGLEPPDLRRRYCNGVLWSPSYFAAGGGGAPIGIRKAYSEQQNKPLQQLTGAGPAGPGLTPARIKSSQKTPLPSTFLLLP
jgi:putative transposase